MAAFEALAMAPPASAVSLPPACRTPAPELAKAPVVVTVSALLAATAPLLSREPAETLALPADCSVPVLVSCAPTCTLSLLPAVCDRSQVPALSSVLLALTWLPPLDWIQPALL